MPATGLCRTGPPSTRSTILIRFLGAMADAAGSPSACGRDPLTGRSSGEARLSRSAAVGSLLVMRLVVARTGYLRFAWLMAGRVGLSRGSGKPKAQLRAAFGAVLVRLSGGDQLLD